MQNHSSVAVAANDNIICIQAIQNTATVVHKGPHVQDKSVFNNHTIMMTSLFYCKRRPSWFMAEV